MSPVLLNSLASSTLTLCLIFFLTAVLSLPLGLLVAFGRMSRFKLLSEPVRFYQLVMRGTPLILQLMFVYFAPYYIFGFSFKRFTACIVGFTINYAAYFAEIYRGGIASIPKGQYEAGRVLGFSQRQTFLRIILPQVIKGILPPMGSEFMTLVKDTALASVIAVPEVFRVASSAASRSFSTWPLVYAGVIYFLLNYIVEFSFHFAEKKLDYYR
ncbi:MAG: amino acid ABC transporter permease [Bacillota bacterium]|nr:amino acid ABC transporter permease [Bacillota bacterium]